MKHILSVLLSFTYTNVLLKLAGIINCSWILVFMPIWLPVLIIIILIILILLAISAEDKKNKIANYYDHDPYC